MRPAGPDGTAQVLRLASRCGATGSRVTVAEALALLLPVLDRPDARADPELFGAALVTATLAARYADIAAALRLGEQAVKVARQLNADRLLIESLAALGATLTTSSASRSEDWPSDGKLSSAPASWAMMSCSA